MNPAAPVSTLTADQAVDELAKILDSAPDESDQLAFICWKRDYSARAQQLEQHIIHLQNLSEKAIQSPAGSDPISQDAPPPSLAA